MSLDVLSRLRYQSPAIRQRMELQRSWVAEKGGLRRAAEDALRRAVGEKARAGEEAAKEVLYCIFVYFVLN